MSWNKVISPQSSQFLHRLMATLGSTLLVWLICIPAAHAVPSFARQTGEECAACHIGALGPQLTPHGMMFKLGGFTDNDGKPGHIPLAAMLVGSYAHTSKDLDPTDSSSNDLKRIQEASIFLAGRLSDHLGAFVQATNSSTDHRFSMDNVDIRFAHPVQTGDSQTLLGVTLNNNPTVSDPLNSVPAWRFPFMSPEMVETVSPLIDGVLGQQVGGLSAYAYWNSSVYAELGGYRSLSKGFLDDVNVEAGGKLSKTAPYWRLAWIKDLRKQAWSAGLFGMNADLRPDGSSSGPSDKFRDIGVDGTYQYLGTRKHIYTVNAAYIHERQTRDASFAAGEAANLSGDLNRIDLNGSYYYDQTYGVTAAYFRVKGDSDATLYADSAAGSPDTTGWILQADWTPFGKENSWGAPWANVRLGLQYTWYTRFLGTKNNYDGAGRNASDNNTAYAFIWLAF
ncbi:MAG TPA: cytochrome C [Thiobacillus sp.]